MNRTIIITNIPQPDHKIIDVDFEDITEEQEEKD